MGSHPVAVFTVRRNSRREALRSSPSGRIWAPTAGTRRVIIFVLSFDLPVRELRDRQDRIQYSLEPTEKDLGVLQNNLCRVISVCVILVAESRGANMPGNFVGTNVRLRRRGRIVPGFCFHCTVIKWLVSVIFLSVTLIFRSRLGLLLRNPLQRPTRERKNLITAIGLPSTYDSSDLTLYGHTICKLTPLVYITYGAIAHLGQ